MAWLLGRHGGTGIAERRHTAGATGRRVRCHRHNPRDLVVVGIILLVFWIIKGIVIGGLMVWEWVFPTRTAFEIPAAPGKPSMLLYRSRKKYFIEWQGEKIGLALDEHLLGLAAVENRRLFVFTSRNPKFDVYREDEPPVHIGCIQDGKLYEVDPIDKAEESANHLPDEDVPLWAQWISAKVAEPYRMIDGSLPEWIRDVPVIKSAETWGDDNPTPESQLFSLAATPQVGQAKALLDSKVDVDCRSPGGRTPLMNAALHGNLPMMELLLEYGADVAARNLDGETALAYAQTGRHEEAARFLCQKLGVPFDMPDETPPGARGE